MIDTQCQYDAMLGMWKDRGFSLREKPDPIDEGDKLIVLSFNGEKIGTFYKSKLMKRLANVPFIQQCCENYWQSLLRHFRMEANQ